MKKLKKISQREIRYILIFLLTGIIVSILAEKFGIVKSRVLYRLISHFLHAITR